LKILYAVQATGNGHIARSVELVPYLQQYGTVDIFLSGSNSDLQSGLPVKYRSKGLSLFYHKNGGLDYWRMVKELSVVNAYKDAMQLPIEKYDIVINDFDSITSLACRLKRVPTINLGHQASFQSDKTPRPPKKETAGELVLKKFATATNYVGLHFEQYDDFIFNPIIKKEILHASTNDKGYITVYLSHYADEVVATHLHQLKDTRFEVFSKKVKQVTVDRNITFIPISNSAFNESMINCSGIITGAGFETPAEALYLGKKLLCLPIKGQYEQLCNAEALKQFNVPVIACIDHSFTNTIKGWLNSTSPRPLLLKHSTDFIVEHVIDKALYLERENIFVPA
jgi:uncharacterized protein (TIGR00661 family)